MSWASRSTTPTATVTYATAQGYDGERQRVPELFDTYVTNDDNFGEKPYTFMMLLVSRVAQLADQVTRMSCGLNSTYETSPHFVCQPNRPHIARSTAEYT